MTHDTFDKIALAIIAEEQLLYEVRSCSNIQSQRLKLEIRKGKIIFIFI